MSNALIEAMVNGCKPIVSDIPENRDTAFILQSFTIKEIVLKN